MNDANKPAFKNEKTLKEFLMSQEAVALAQTELSLKETELTV